MFRVRFFGLGSVGIGEMGKGRELFLFSSFCLVEVGDFSLFFLGGFLCGGSCFG